MRSPRKASTVAVDAYRSQSIRAMATGRSRSRAFSTAKAQRLLGCTASIDLDEGLRRTTEWYFAQGHLSGAAKGAGSSVQAARPGR